MILLGLKAGGGGGGGGGPGWGGQQFNFTNVDPHQTFRMFFVRKRSTFFLKFHSLENNLGRCRSICNVFRW
jgi:hypothetical protein